MPFREFFQRRGVRHALSILAFLFLYKLGDNMATALATPFYLDMGFTASQIGIVAKNAALWPAIIGGMLGALIIVLVLLPVVIFLPVRMQALGSSPACVRSRRSATAPLAGSSALRF